MLSFKRSDRVSELILHEVSKIVQHLKVQGLGFVTITGVKITDDLQEAIVYYSVIGNEREVKSSVEIIKKQTPSIRYQLAQKVKLRRMPTLLFKFDETPEKASRVFELLEQVNKEEPLPETQEPTEKSNEI